MWFDTRITLSGRLFQGEVPCAAGRSKWKVGAVDVHVKNREAEDALHFSHGDNRAKDMSTVT